MYPVLPHEMLTSGFEVCCYGATVLAAFLGWFFSVR